MKNVNAALLLSFLLAEPVRVYALEADSEQLEGEVAATEYDRNQHRFAYGHRLSSAEIMLGAVINRTGDSGTPALPIFCA